MNRLKITFCIFILLTTVLQAQEDAGQAGEFLRYGVGGRALGMGRAFTAVADDASGLYWNPAGLVGATRFELTSMYSNLYYDSQFAHMGLVLPRPMENVQNPLLKFLFGPSSAIGLGWVGLSMIDFEQRTKYGEYLGDFDLQENAMLFAWAREHVSSWGILRYGTTLNWISRSMGGLSIADNVYSSDSDRDQTWGLDAGMTFQPINFPGLNAISLRYLLPLKIGFSAKNIKQPQWRGNEKYNRFPRTYRLGFSYRIIFADWLPESWDTVQAWFRRCQILTVYDLEMSADRKKGHYFGFEALLPVPGTDVAITPRWGVNTRTEGASLGLGLQLPFANTATVRLDYAYEFHPFLKSDNRFFITLQTGKLLDAVHFKDRYNNADLSMKDRKNHLYRILSQYPDETVKFAATKLIDLENADRTPRYYDLIGGLGWAEWLFYKSKELMAENNTDEARKQAASAVEEYQVANITLMTEEQLMNYGEALLMIGSVEDALDKLTLVDTPSLRSYYLKGVAQKGVGAIDEAIATFDAAIQVSENDSKASMINLSFLKWAECLAIQSRYGSAVVAIEKLLEREKGALAPDYPQMPNIEDQYIVDDALFLKGLCQILNSRVEERISLGIDAILSIDRFYPNLTYGFLATNIAEQLIALQTANDVEGLYSLCDELLSDYMVTHQWPLP
ncbi:hypothetical protein KAR48_05500 [bacterium]|nr:hypothetical protein [bacterium]